MGTEAQARIRAKMARNRVDIGRVYAFSDAEKQGTEAAAQSVRSLDGWECSGVRG
ncbi:hypothetical protein TM239_48910 [Bradyrhizobium sp. TM239]|nr:hypothetical protein TM239_48910 [Bradyrhizobium sp. TM239]